MVVPYQPVILDHSGTYLHSSFSPDGSHLAVVSEGNTTGYGQSDGPLTIVTTPALAVIWQMDGWLEAMRAEGGQRANLSFHPSGRTFAFANKVWDVSTGQVVGQIDTANGLSFSPDGLTLVGSTAGWAADEEQDGSSDADEDVYEEPPWYCLLLDSQTGQTLRRLTKENDEQELFDVRFVHDGARVTALGYEYDHSDRAYFWDTQSGEQLPTFDKVEEVAGGFEVRLQVSPSGRYVITTSGEAQVWEREEKPEMASNPWRYRYTCRGHARGVWEASFSGDERLLVTMGAETLDYEGDEATAFSVRVWDVASGQEQAKCAVAGKCYAFGLSPDNRFLATMSAETKNYFKDEADAYILTLWETASGQMLTQRTTASKKTNLLYHYPTGAVFSPNGRWLVVTHLRHAEVWDMQSILDSGS